MTLLNLDPALTPKYRVVGEFVDMRIQPTYRPFDWMAPQTPDAVEGLVEWRVLDVSTDEVIATYSIPLSEMVVADDANDYLSAVIGRAMNRFRTGRAAPRLAG